VNNKRTTSEQQVNTNNNDNNDNNDNNIYSSEKNNNGYQMDTNGISMVDAGEDRIVENSRGKKTSEQSSHEINKVFDVFYEINPTINYGNKTSRKAAEWMIHKWGVDAVISMAEYACSIHGKPYAPTVTTPYQLKEKISTIKAYKEKQENTHNKITII